MSYADDVQMIGLKLAQLCPADSADGFRAFVHLGVPVPWQRVGLRGGRSFTPAKTRKAERDLAYCFRSAVLERPIYSNVALLAVFYMPDRRRRDLDNLLKTVMDAGTQAGVWRDDCQVTAQAGFVELDASDPRTVVGLMPIRGSLDRTVPANKRARRSLLEATQ